MDDRSFAPFLLQGTRYNHRATASQAYFFLLGVAVGEKSTGRVPYGASHARACESTRRITEWHHALKLVRMDPPADHGFTQSVQAGLEQAGNPPCSTSEMRDRERIGEMWSANGCSGCVREGNASSERPTQYQSAFVPMICSFQMLHPSSPRLSQYFSLTNALCLAIVYHPGFIWLRQFRPG